MPASCDWSTLPPTALINILRRLNYEDAFTSCAFVCKAWADAVVQAQQFLYLSDLDEDRVGQFEWWLWRKGHNVTYLHIDTVESVKALPCPHLRELSLECYGEPMTAGFGFLLHLAAATSLTCISLDGIKLSVPRQHDAYDVLGQLPSLQNLTWINTTIKYRSQGSSTEGDPAPYPGPPASFLQQATGLTYLHADWRCTDKTFQHASCLQRLQELLLWHLEDVSTTGLTGLRELPRLTSLQLDRDSSDGSRTTPYAALRSLSCLTALEVLSMGYVPAAPLGGLFCQRLTELRVECLRGFLTPETVPGFSRLTALRNLHLWADKNNTQSRVVFSVALLESLTQLVCLHLSDMQLRGAEQQPRSTPLTAWLCRANSAQRVRAAARPLPNFAPLLASRQLSRLLLFSCTFEQADRYSSISGCSSPWQQVFSVQQQPHQLDKLWLQGVVPSLVPADMQCLVQACPGLSSLDLAIAMKQAEGDWPPLNPGPLRELPPGPRPWVNDLQAASLAALTALTALTELRFCEPDETACQALGQLTQLEHLVLYNPSRVTRAGFRALTSLTRLTALGFGTLGMSCAAARFLGLKATEVALAVQRHLQDEADWPYRGLSENSSVSAQGTLPTYVNRRLMQLVRVNDAYRYRPYYYGPFLYAFEYLED